MQVLNPYGSKILGLLTRQRERISPASVSAALLWISLPHNPAVHPSLSCWAGALAAEVKPSFSSWGIMKKLIVSSELNFMCTQRNKNNPTVQHIGESIAALGSCKRKMTQGNFRGRKKQQGVLTPAWRISTESAGLGEPSQGCTKVCYTCSLEEKIAAWSFPRGRHINVHTISSGEVTTSPA